MPMMMTMRVSMEVVRAGEHLLVPPLQPPCVHCSEFT